MKNNKKSLKENVFRSLIRKEIKKILEAEEAETAPEEAPKEEPKEEEEGLSASVQGTVSEFVRKLKDAGEVQSEDVAEIVSIVIEAFADSSEQKLNILRSVKSNIVR